MGNKKAKSRERISIVLGISALSVVVASMTLSFSVMRPKKYSTGNSRACHIRTFLEARAGRGSRLRQQFHPGRTLLVGGQSLLILIWLTRPPSCWESSVRSWPSRVAHKLTSTVCNASETVAQDAVPSGRSGSTPYASPHLSTDVANRNEARSRICVSPTRRFLKPSPHSAAQAAESPAARPEAEWSAPSPAFG